MGIAHYIREIGRGKDGARSLSEAQAHDLMTQLLEGRLSGVELGAFALAMRMKGETLDELAGFVRAARDHCVALVPAGPLIVLPSYNGARRLPNLTALLALLLAQAGANVLVHGVAHDADRTTTADIFHHLGLPTARDAADAHHAWARHEPVFMALETWCAPLAQLLALREQTGVRNSGHTIAKVLAPCSVHTVLKVVNYTHPEYATLLADHLTATGADAMLLRGTEGEPAADPRRLPRLDVFIGGRVRPECSRAAQDGVLAELPVLPRERDAGTTAHYIQAVVGGEKPAPGPLLAQVDTLLAAVAAAECEHARERLA